MAITKKKRILSKISVPGINRREFFKLFGTATAVYGIHYFGKVFYPLFYNPPDMEKYISSNSDNPSNYLRYPRPFKDIGKEIFLAYPASSYEENLLLKSVQGIVNRYETNTFIYSYNTKWHHVLKERGIDLSETHWTKLISKYRERFRGLILWDPDLIDTVNVGTTLAGIHNLILAPVSLIKYLKDTEDLEVVEDLRGRWKNKDDVYKWAIDELFPISNQDVVANLNPKNVNLRDYIVMGSILTVDLDPSPFLYTSDKILAARLFSKTKNNTPVMGWPNSPSLEKLSETLKKINLDALHEFYYISDISFEGNFATVSDFCENLSLLSADRIEDLKQKRFESIFDDSRKYVSFAYSDGDNLVFVQGKMQYLWMDRNRGKVPIGWSIAPTTLDLMPSVIKYYYNTSTIYDNFICPPSGVGYIHPSKKTYLDKFLRYTKTYTSRADQDVLTILDYPSSSESIIRRIVDHLDNIKGIILNYRPSTSGYFFSNNTPVVSPVQAFFDEETAEDVARKIRESKDDIVCVMVNGWIGTPTDIKRIAELLFPEYIAIRPDNLMKFIKMKEGKGKNR